MALAGSATGSEFARMPRWTTDVHGRGRRGWRRAPTTSPIARRLDHGSALGREAKQAAHGGCSGGPNSTGSLRQQQQVLFRARPSTIVPTSTNGRGLAHSHRSRAHGTVDRPADADRWGDSMETDGDAPFHLQVLLAVGENTAPGNPAKNPDSSGCRGVVRSRGTLAGFGRVLPLRVGTAFAGSPSKADEGRFPSRGIPTATGKRRSSRPFFKAPTGWRWARKSHQGGLVGAGLGRGWELGAERGSKGGWDKVISVGLQLLQKPVQSTIANRREQGARNGRPAQENNQIRYGS